MPGRANLGEDDECRGNGVAICPEGKKMGKGESGEKSRKRGEKRGQTSLQCVT